MIRSTARIRILLLLAVMFCQPVSAQNGNPIRIYDVVTRGNAEPGFYLLAPTTNTNLNVVDHGGWLVHSTPASSATNLQRHIDGTFTYFVPRVGHIRMDSTFSVAIDTIVSKGGSTDFHDVRVLRNGNYMVLGAKPRTVDMSVIVQGGKANATIGDALLEEQRPDGTVVWQWNSKDHTSILDATSDIDLRGGTVDYIHVNSIYEDDDGHIIISARHFDEAIKINRTTGSIVWRLGGKESKNNQFRWLNDTTNGFWGFSHQHTVSRTKAGRILLFDNGNLKTPEYSRAVEYEVDEVTKTVRRVWQYRPPIDIASRSMGSVERLSNGGTLIGWGRNFSKMVLTELDSNDNVVYEFKNMENNNTASYRASKYPVHMLADQLRTSSSNVTHSFASDSAVGIQVTVQRVSGPRTLNAERYAYGPMDAAYETAAPLLIDSMRWVVRHNLASTDVASMGIDLRCTPRIRDPRRAIVWYRPLDGSGAFRRLPSFKDSSTYTYRLDSFSVGEYIVGYDVDLRPQPVHPVRDTVADAFPPVLTWRGALSATEYVVHVSVDSTFTAQVLEAITATETLVRQGLQPFERYYWRVRARGSGADSGWSAVASFRTPLATPTITFPTMDARVTPEHSRIEWTRVLRADSYRAILTGPSDSIVLDTVTTDTVVHLVGIPGDTRLGLRVVAMRADVTSAKPSQVAFGTVPYVPSDCNPATATTSLDPEVVLLRWSAQPDVRSHVEVRSITASTILYDDTIAANQRLLTSLPLCSHYQWRVRAVGTNGVSAWTAYRWFGIAGDASGSAPELVAPSDGATPDAATITFLWTSASNDGIAFLQIDTTSRFFDPIVDTVVGIGGTTMQVTPTRALPEDRTLFWRVYETNGSGCGSFSSVRQFVIPGSGLGPLLPADGAVDVAVNGEVRYTTSSRFVNYRVEFYAEADSIEPEKIYTSSTNTCRYLGLQPGIWYRWRVIGTTITGELVSGSQSKFRTRQTSSLAAEEEKELRIISDERGLVIRGSYTNDVTCTVHDITGRVIPVVSMYGGGHDTIWFANQESVRGILIVTLVHHGRVVHRRIVCSVN